MIHAVARPASTAHRTDVLPSPSTRLPPPVMRRPAGMERTMTAMGMIMSMGWGSMSGSFSASRMDSSIMGVAPGQRSWPSWVRASAFFMGPMLKSKSTTKRVRATAARA